MGNMTQANSISNALKASFGIDSKITGLIVMALTFLVILGGIRSIAKVAEIVVPAMAGFYILGALIVILFHFRDIPAGLYEIFSQAAAIRTVTLKAVTKFLIYHYRCLAVGRSKRSIFQ